MYLRQAKNAKLVLIKAIFVVEIVVFFRYNEIRRTSEGMRSMKKLNLGVAYHGNRILKHVQEDMRDIVNHNMNFVVHMFSHNDMDRHKNIMKEIFDITKSYGLDIWVDNWGIGGPPGDKSHILQYYPDAHQVYSDGSVDPVRACFNNENFIGFTKHWIDTVKECGGEKLFWDEPHLPTKENGVYACCCPKCRKLFEEKYGKSMPETVTDEVIAFQNESVRNYFAAVTAYAAALGLENIVLLMAVSTQFKDGIATLPHVSNLGIDPYWISGNDDPYGFVYDYSKQYIETAKANGKDSHIWLQTYANPAGKEDDIYMAAEAAYDAGARTLVAWGYRGSESNDYRAANCDMVWNVTGDAMRRIKDRYLDALREEKRKQFMHCGI